MDSKVSLLNRESSFVPILRWSLDHERKLVQPKIDKRPFTVRSRSQSIRFHNQHKSLMRTGSSRSVMTPGVPKLQRLMRADFYASVMTL